MAKSSQVKIKGRAKSEIEVLAEQFEKAWHNSVDDTQPEGSITASQYSKNNGLSYFTGRRRLEELIERGLVKKSDRRYGKSFVYFLK